MKDSYKLNDLELEMLENELKNFFGTLEMSCDFNKEPMINFHMCRDQNGERRWKTYEYDINIIKNDIIIFNKLFHFYLNKNIEKEIDDAVLHLAIDYWFENDHNRESALGKKIFKETHV
ncbi:MAG TPA: hypothetical protein PLB38_01400 [bacterium]|nr:hypothetical protein [bacterium]